MWFINMDDKLCMMFGRIYYTLYSLKVQTDTSIYDIMEVKNLTLISFLALL